jgi:hypothetical protein
MHTVGRHPLQSSETFGEKTHDEKAKQSSLATDGIAEVAVLMLSTMASFLFTKGKPFTSERNLRVLFKKE